MATTTRKAPARGAAAAPAVRKPKAAAEPAKAALAPAKTAIRPAKVKAEKAGKAEKAEKADKPKKPKLVRDSFTIPKAEYAVLDDLKARAAKAGAPSKKSEVLRAGLKALAAMPEAAFLAAMAAVPAVKTGRPAKG